MDRTGAEQHRDVGEHHLHMAAVQVVYGPARARLGNVHQLDAGASL